MNTPEQQQHRPERQPREIKHSLMDTIKGLFRSMAPEQETKVKDYLEKPPEDTSSQSEITDGQKLKHQTQKTRLDDLKATLNMVTATVMPDAPEAVIGYARGAAAELGGKTDYVFQAEFYKKLAKTPVQGNFELPFARYVALSADKIATSDRMTSVKQKTELAFEVFVSETGETLAAMPTLKAIIGNIVSSHGENHEEVRKYFETAEFKDLARKYGLNSEQIKELGLSPSENTPETDDSSNKRPSLMDFKRMLLESVPDDETRIRLDVELLSLSPDRILTLLRTVPQDEISELRGRGNDSDLLKQLESPVAKDPFLKDPSVNNWINDFFSKSKIPVAEQAGLTGQVRDYFLQIRNELYVSKVKRFPHSPYMGENPYQQWVNQFKDDIIAADLMMGTDDPFLFVEYFKGKIAQVIRKPEENKVDELIESFKKGKRFDINEHQIYGEVLRDLRQAWLARISQTEDQNFQRAAANLTTSIAKMKQDALVKRHTAFGNVYDENGNAETKKGAEIMFKYRYKSEEVELGGQYTQNRALHDPTLAHMTAVFPKAMSEFGEAYKVLSEFASMAETGGDPEKIAGAAKAITNNLVDVAIEQAPVVLQSMQSYLRIFREKLSANSNVLGPDFFSDTPFVKDEIMKLLEMEIKNTHPDITDFEREIYLKMGKGLAIASGEFIATLANALPPMTHSINKVPEKIAKKIQSGQTLSLAEMKILEGSFAPEFKDFPFRGLLMNMNPLRWLHSWIKYNDYGAFNLSFMPNKTGQNAMDPVDAWDSTQKIMLSSFLGLDDDVVQYFDGKHIIPFFELSKMNQNISLLKRGGVRRRVMQLVEGDYVIKNRDAKTGLQYIDGVDSFRKLVHKSPMLAYYFMTDPGSHGSIAVQWPSADSKHSNLPSAELKSQLTQELMDYMHEYYPTFFTSLEQPHFFRRKELSFSQGIRDRIHTNLKNDESHQNGYWLFLNEDERHENIASQADPMPLGRKYMHENIIATRRVAERMNVVLQELQTFIQIRSPYTPDGKRALSIRDFVMASDMKSYNGDLYDVLGKAVGNISNLYGLSPSDKSEMMKGFQQYCKEIYYANDSVFKSQSYLGTDQNGQARRIDKYYLKLLNDGLLVNPFDWAYFDKTELTYQSTGTNMTSRNVGDFGHMMGHTSKYMGFMNAIQDAITSPEKSKDIIKAAIDKIEGSVNDITTAYSAEDGARAGWVASAFLTYPFIASRWKDLPLAGKNPLIHSWATMVNHDDYRGLNAWDGQTRKEVLDHTLSKEWSKSILDYAKDNKLIEEVSTTFKFKNPFKKDKNGEPVEVDTGIKIPGFARKIFGRKFKDRFEEGSQDFSVDSFKSYLKTESWWLGGKENFGIGYNVLLSIFVIGFLMMLFQSLKEGMKSAEIK